MSRSRFLRVVTCSKTHPTQMVLNTKALMKQKAISNDKVSTQYILFFGTKLCLMQGKYFLMFAFPQDFSPLSGRHLEVVFFQESHFWSWSYNPFGNPFFTLIPRKKGETTYILCRNSDCYVRSHFGSLQSVYISQVCLHPLFMPFSASLTKH